MSKLSLFVQSPLIPSLASGILAIDQGEMFSVHALKIDSELFPLLLEARPCVLLASISDAETNSLTYQLMKDLQEYRVGQSAPSRDPALRIVIISEGQVPRLNWSHLGIHELMVGPVAQNVLQYKLSRHYQKALAAAADELTSDVESQIELKPHLVSAPANEESPPWRLFKATPNWQSPEVQRRIQQNQLSEKISVRVRIPGLETRAGEWKRKENLEGGDDLWEWVEKPKEASETRKQWTYVGTTEPEFQPEDGSWQFKGSRPRLLLRKPNETADQVYFEYIPETEVTLEPQLKAVLEAEVKHAKIERFEKKPLKKTPAERPKPIYPKLKEPVHEQGHRSAVRAKTDGYSEEPGKPKIKSQSFFESDPSIPTKIKLRNRERSERDAADSSNASVSADESRIEKDIDDAIQALLEASSPKNLSPSPSEFQATQPKADADELPNRSTQNSPAFREAQRQAALVEKQFDRIKEDAEKYAAQALAQKRQSLTTAPNKTEVLQGSTEDTPQTPQSPDELSSVNSVSLQQSDQEKKILEKRASRDLVKAPRDFGRAPKARDMDLSTAKPIAELVSEAKIASPVNQLKTIPEKRQSVLRGSFRDQGPTRFKIEGDSNEQSLSALFDDETTKRSRSLKKSSSSESEKESINESYEWKFKKVKKLPASLSPKQLEDNALLKPKILSQEDQKSMMDRILSFLLSIVRPR